MRTVPRGAILATVAFGVFVAADDLTVVATTLRDIVGDLAIPLPEGLDDAAWIVNGYLVAYVAVMPLMGRLADVVGRRRTFVGALAVFGLGSLALPHATSLGWFTVGRVVTAIGGAAMIPVALAVTADLYEGRERTRALGLLGALDVLGWVWGPLFGALLVRFLDWRWQFHLNVPLAVAGIAAAWWTMRDLDHADSRRRLDLPGALLLSGGLVAVTLALLDSADISVAEGLEDLTGSGGLPVLPLFAGGAVLLAAFTVVEVRRPDPLVDLASLRDRRYAGALVTTLLVGGALVVAMVDVPLFVNLVLEDGVEAAAVRSGWILSALTLAMAIGTLVGGTVAAQWGARPTVVAGTLVAGGGFLLMALTWDPGVATPAMATHLAVLGFGLGSVTAPLHDRAVSAVGHRRRGMAGSMVVLARLTGLTLGLAGLTAWALQRFEALRQTITLPPITDPGYEAAARTAQATISADALAATFGAAAIVCALAALVAAVLLGSEVADGDR